MLKVGDKVKVKEDLVRRQRRGSHYYYFIAEAMCKYRGEIVTISKINVNEQYLLIEEDDNRWKWTEDMFDKIEDNNMKELTFKEVIANIKEGEIWESEEYKIIYFDNTIGIQSKGKIEYGVYPKTDSKFRLQRKSYTFQEAFKFYEEGKTIESCKSTKIYSKDRETKNSYGYYLMSLDEIRGRWYIND
ncbi:hypothetical protein [Clostridium perfringens]|uniref:hypothetical protein n=1 Tax=Clostridium perfringens TaxID=1502 RepID=UPI003F426964